MRAVHELAVQRMLMVDEDLRTSCRGDKAECADLAYALREIRELAEDIRKRCDAHGRTAQASACMLQIVDGKADSIKTDFCTATPTCQTIVAIPKKASDPEGFTALMRHLNVPDDLWKDREHAALSVNWPGLVELLSQQQAQGLPLPPGIDPNKTHSEYKLRILSRKPIVGNEQSAESVF